MKMTSLTSQLIVAIIAIIDGLFSLFCKVSSVFSSLPEQVNIVSMVVFILLGAFLIFVNILNFLEDRKKCIRKHRFLYQSEEFFKFFADWYRQPGVLSIICKDIEWIKNDNNTAVYNQLLNKSRDKQLNLMLGDGIHLPIAEELKRYGAKVMPAPNNVVSNYTFSCLSIMGDIAGKIIVRDKSNSSVDAEDIIIEEVSNTYVTELLNALLTEGTAIDE